MSDHILTEEERRLLVEIQDGLPIVKRPYELVARRLSMTEERVLAILASLFDRGVIKRIGAVPNHYALGFTANGMAVWDVPDDAVSDLGHRLAARPEVTHCYRRPRRPPDWPYNLYAMVHGRTREEVTGVVGQIAREANLDGLPHGLLFSVRALRKRGTRLISKSPSN
jgi:DNA-binding Lrp family transcriptional regulator